jgi:hypothetical protein
VAKRLLFCLFAVPFQDRHSKPFVDRTITFLRDGDTIVIRHYQIQWGDDGAATELAEIGPWVCLLPNFVLVGVFKGHKIWKNVAVRAVEAERREKVEQRKRAREVQADREEKKLRVPAIPHPHKGLFDE